jgi:hypothetical protein
MDGQKILSGIALTMDDYVYVINNHGNYLFNHILDPLNVSNLFQGLNNITGSHQHVQNWFDKEMMENLTSKLIPNLEDILFSLSEDGYVRKDLLGLTRKV